MTSLPSSASPRARSRGATSTAVRWWGQYEYVPTLDAFQIIPHVYFQPEVPFALNLGVLTHEYGHRVFALLAENGERAELPTGWSDSTKLQYASPSTPRPWRGGTCRPRVCPV